MSKLTVIFSQPGKSLFYLLLLVWFLINLGQARFTEINADEAYYFLWGQYPAWGYFDHPPMVGWLTNISSLIFENNLGARFLTPVLQTGTLFLTWMQLENKKWERKSIISFFIIAGSLVMFNAFGFITTPDVPLLFFTALFLFNYKNFIHRPDWMAILLLAISMGGLLYSKYHGVLVIGFVVLSNLRLLLDWKFWLAGILALILCLPHFWWLYEHDFPGFRYQFAAFEFKIIHFIEYIPTALAAFNPITLGLVIFILARYRPSDKIERAHYYVLGGLLFFFWLLAYKGQVQAQWMVAASISIIVLLHNRSAIDPKFYRYIRKFIAPTLALILIARILLVTNLLPQSMGLSGKEPDYRRLEIISGEKPVIFTRGYQQAALYSFFTQKPSTVISSLVIRRSQFDIWKFDQKWALDSVLVLVQENRSPIFDLQKGIKRIFPAGHFQTPNELKIQFEINQPRFRPGDSLSLNFSLENRGSYTVYFQDPVYPMQVIPVFRDRSGFVYRGVGKLNDSLYTLPSGKKLDLRLHFRIPSIPAGKYDLGISCNSEFGPANNSNFIKIEIEW